MNGITNAQQQGGGGGGGAASYKAIKSLLPYDAWQEVSGVTPFFVGENAATWPVNPESGMPTKSQNTNLGLVAGNSYTITIVADNVTYTKTSEAFGGEQTGGAVILGFDMSTPELDLYIYVYDKWDAATMSPAAQGSMCVNGAEADNLVITNFEGEGFGKSIQATISDSAIKVNSAVTMYTNTSEKIAAGKKTDGSVTLTADVAPELSISYSLEIVGTDTEGLFEIVNGYVPEIPSVSSNYDDLSNIPVINQDLSATGFTPVKDTYYRHTGTTNRDYTKGVIYKCVDVGSTNESLEMYEVASMYDVYTAINESVAPLLPVEKDITNASTNVSITGVEGPYLFTVTDSDISSYDFIRLYPMDEGTETWLNEHTVSSIITEESGKFTFKVDTNTLPTAFSIKYIIESFL